MEPIFQTEIIKYKNGKSIGEIQDTLVREIKLEIYINGDKIGALMATPTDQEALAIGYLMSENIIESAKDIKNFKLENDGMQIHINAKINEEHLKSLNSEAVVISGCGRSLSANIDPKEIEAKVITNPFKIKPEIIFKQMATFYTQCELYEQTGCVHTAKLYIDENTFFIGEDIAQHNTIDKAVGKAQIKGANLQNSFLMVSGRLSSEMVAKAVMHQIPVLISRTASTCLGVMIARKFNLTLIGFARGENMNVYSGHDRLDG